MTLTPSLEMANILNSNKVFFNPIKESIMSDINVGRLFGIMADMSHKESSSTVLI